MQSYIIVKTSLQNNTTGGRDSTAQNSLLINIIMLYILMSTKCKIHCNQNARLKKNDNLYNTDYTSIVYQYLSVFI